MDGNRRSHLFVVFVAMMLPAMAAYAVDAPLAPGTAAGAFTVDGKATKLAYAAAFVDQKDSQKPTILILSDRQLPVAKWKSESDYTMFRMDQRFIGVAFWLDKEGKVFRCDYYDTKPIPTSTGGIFELKLDAAAGKDLKGSAVSTAAAAGNPHHPKLEVRFHATR